MMHQGTEKVDEKSPSITTVSGRNGSPVLRSRTECLFFGLQSNSQRPYHRLDQTIGRSSKFSEINVYSVERKLRIGKAEYVENIHF